MIETLDEYYYRRALWFLLPHKFRNIYIEDLDINYQDFDDFVNCAGRWEGSDMFDISGVAQSPLMEARADAYSLTYPDATARRLMTKTKTSATAV